MWVTTTSALAALERTFFQMTRCRRRPISAYRLGGDLCLQCVTRNFVSIALCCKGAETTWNVSVFGFKVTTTCTFTAKPFRWSMTLCYLCKLPRASCIWTLGLRFSSATYASCRALHAFGPWVCASASNRRSRFHKSLESEPAAAPHRDPWGKSLA